MFKGDLTDFASRILLDRTTAQRGLFSVAAMEKLLRSQRAGRLRVGGVLWSAVIFELWARAFLDCRPPAAAA
jgi:hypothetical protein